MGASPTIHPAEQAPASLNRCLETLTKVLRAHISPGIGLYDPADEAPTPADHYGQTAAALALALQDGAGAGAWRLPLETWNTFPAQQTGHAPFNRFLLNLLAEYLDRSSAPASEVAHIQRSARRCKLTRRYASNNWSLLARLCELQEARGNARTRAHVRLRGLLDRWTTPSGAFVDYPASPGRPARGATPAAYHHKALFVAVMAAEYGDQEAWQAMIEKLLAWSLYVWDGHGHAGGLGRSSHALFGDACLVASLILLGAGQSSVHETSANRMLRDILQRWQDQTRPDGFIALNPADLSSPGSGWDNYMHLSVYNAWTAAIIAWAHERTVQAVRPPASTEILDCSPSSLFENDTYGPLRIGGPKATFALVSGLGQPPQAYSRGEVELRYAGGVPLHVSWKGTNLCSAPIRVTHQSLVQTPALAGWTPIFLAGDTLYGLTDFDHCEHQLLDHAVRISLSGHPTALHRPRPSEIKDRAIATLDWRFFDGALGRRAALHRPRLWSVRGHLVLTVHIKRPCIEQEIQLDHQSTEPVHYLNPGGHGITDAPLVESSFRARLNSAGATRTVLPDVWQESDMPSSIPRTRGRSQAPLQLPNGNYEAQLTIIWASEPSAPSPTRPDSTSSSLGPHTTL